jgi:N-acetylglucosamine-6-phosphate deacetylase
MRRRRVLKNAKLYTPNGIIENGYMVVASDGKIQAIGYGETDTTEHDEIEVGHGKIVLPGFVDVHVHGGGGFGMSLATFDAVNGMSLFHAGYGTTSFLATTSTADTEQTLSALSNAVKAIGRTTGADLIGIHLEGPYLNPKRAGAQDKENIRVPDRDELEQFILATSNHMRLVTLAPELEGGMDVVRMLCGKEITVSVGHSDATYEEVQAAVSLGLNHTTHHFNGMSPFMHRAPGVAGAGLMMKELTTELICDGIHVHPAVVKHLFEAKGPEHVCMITDAVTAAGLPNGVYEKVKVIDGAIYLLDGSSLAGSSLTMLQALKNAIQFTGYSIERLLPSMTSVPARQARMGHQKGSLEVGKDADFLILSDELELLATYVRGTQVFSSKP